MEGKGKNGEVRKLDSERQKDAAEVVPVWRL